MKKLGLVVWVLVGAAFFTSSMALAQRSASSSEAQSYIEREVMPALDQDPFSSRIFRDFPEHRAQFINVLAAAYDEQGQSGLEAAGQDYMFGVGAAVTPYYMVRSRDSDLIAMYRVILTVANNLAETDPLRCTNFFLGAPMPDGSQAMDTGDTSIAPHAAQLELVTGQMFANAGENPVPVDRQMAQSSIESVGLVMGAELDARTLDLVGQVEPITTVDDQIKYCNGLSVFFVEILRLPSDQAANTFRSFLG